MPPLFDRLPLSAVPALVAALFMGCSGESLLVVNVVTDLEPGVDFVGVEVEVSRGASVVGDRMFIATSQDWTRSVRVAEFTGLPDGDILVRATLLAPLAEQVLSSTVLVRFSGSQAVTAVLGSACIQVQCPGPSDSADATECQGGACVPPDCPSCAPSCATDSSCPASEACGAGRCIESRCLYPDGVDLCPEGEVCHPVRGCLAPTCECDDSDPCTRDICAGGGRCTHEPRTGARCDDGLFCNGADVCMDGACTNTGPAPCEGGLCDEPGQRCTTGCADENDCPDDVLGSWSECEYESVCSLGGARTRDATTFACVDSQCEATTTIETDTVMCERDTELDVCGEDRCDPWRECRFAQCATDGSRTRTCYAPRCRGGTCDSGLTSDTDTTSCTRGAQGGMACTDGLCPGTCADGSCAGLCAYCGGFCTITGCFGPGDGGFQRCP